MHVKQKSRLSNFQTGRKKKRSKVNVINAIGDKEETINK